MIIRCAGFLLLVYTATACSGASNSPAGTPCPLVLPASTLNYPAAGSANVVDAENLIVVSSYLEPGFIYLQSSTGAAVVPIRDVPVPSPLPTPNLAIRYPSVTALRIPQLAAATTYTVVNQLSTTCANPIYGSFTTR